MKTTFFLATAIVATALTANADVGAGMGGATGFARTESATSSFSVAMPGAGLTFGRAVTRGRATGVGIGNTSGRAGTEATNLTLTETSAGSLGNAASEAAGFGEALGLGEAFSVGAGFGFNN